MGIFAKRTKTKTRRRVRDIDQIKADLVSARHLEKYKDTKAPEDLPGLGANYCIECAKWFDTEKTLTAHRRGKPHRRRVKQVREEPDLSVQKEQVGFSLTQQKSQDVEMAT